MPISRFFQAMPLAVDTEIILSDQAAHHLARVLRAAVNDEVVLFNGQGGEYHGVIARIDKRNVVVHLAQFVSREVESPLDLCLVQGISRGEKMDYTIQKAVELGVKKIIPLISERCNVRLDEDRREKRLQHWRAIATSACEQSGRNQIPDIVVPMSFEQYLASVDSQWRFVLSPHVSGKLSVHSIQAGESVELMIGSEGGLSDKEVMLATQRGFLPLNLGPRVLRTETAAVAAIAALQCFFGDMG